MAAPWTELADGILRPTRPWLARTRARAEAHLARERRAAERRAEALAACRARIEDERSRVFEAGNGVVNARMTTLEREWRSLAHEPHSPRARALALWNELAPPRWADRLRGANDAEWNVEHAIALASDPEGVERAEACARTLAQALAPWGLTVGTAVHWRVASDLHADPIGSWLEAPRAAATDALANVYGGAALLARARAVGETVRAGADRATIGAEVGAVAALDVLWRTCSVEAKLVPAGHLPAGLGFDALPSPTAALLALWQTGYVPCAADVDGFTLGAPPI